MTGRINAPRPPQQARSQATLERLLNAAENLLRQKKFSEITVAEIADTGASSIGAFYKRFSSKADLLPYLLRRFQDRQVAGIKAFVAEPRWEDIGLAERIRVFTTILSSSYLKNHGLIRALVSRQFSDRSELPPDEIRNARIIVDLIAGWLLECRSEIQHKNPEQAIRVGMFFTVTSLQVGILFKPSTKRFSNQVLIEEVTTALIAYLGVSEEIEHSYSPGA